MRVCFGGTIAAYRYFGVHFRSNLRKSAHAAVKNRKGKSYVYNKV